MMAKVKLGQGEEIIEVWEKDPNVQASKPRQVTRLFTAQRIGSQYGVYGG
jgi:hypothetical protein